MQTEGKIADSSNVHLKPWETERLLAAVSQPEARYSRGFLIAEPSAWFSGIVELWMPLLHSLALEVSGMRMHRQFVAPEDIDRAVSVEFDSEHGGIMFSQETAARLSEAIVPGMTGVGADIVLEYVIRRLLSTLSMSWSGTEPLSCSYLGPRDLSLSDAAAFVCVSADLSGSPISLWFALGSRAVDRLDAGWRSRHLEVHPAVGRSALSDRIHSISVELAELAVPPAMLIDYMRPGTVVDLEVPAANGVLLKVDGELWAEGTLCRYNGSVAVQIANTAPEPRVFPDATTRVRIQIAETELDEAGLLEHSQAGAILVCDTPVGAHASLVISGENVASAVVGVIENNFALSVLPK